MILLLSSVVFLCILILYIGLKHTRAKFQPVKPLQDQVSVAAGSIYFTPLTGALKIGDEIISYYSYANDPKVVANAEALIRKSMEGRVPLSAVSGKVAKVEAKGRGRKIFVALVLTVSVIAVVLWFWQQIFLMPGQRKTLLIGFLIPGVLVFKLLADTLYLKIFNTWELKNGDIVIGKWKIRSIIPLKQITAVHIEIARELLRREARKPGFILEVEHGRQTSRFNDMRLNNLLPLYDAIIVRRPDLKIA